MKKRQSAQVFMTSATHSLLHGTSTHNANNPHSLLQRDFGDNSTTSRLLSWHVEFNKYFTFNTNIIAIVLIVSAIKTYLHSCFHQHSHLHQDSHLHQHSQLHQHSHAHQHSHLHQHSHFHQQDSHLHQHSHFHQLWKYNKVRNCNNGNSVGSTRTICTSGTSYAQNELFYTCAYTIRKSSNLFHLHQFLHPHQHGHHQHVHLWIVNNLYSILDLISKTQIYTLLFDSVVQAATLLHG